MMKDVMFADKPFGEFGKLTCCFNYRMIWGLSQFIWKSQWFAMFSRLISRRRASIFFRTISLLKLWRNNAWVCIVKESQTPKQTPSQVSRPDKLYTKRARWGRRWMSRSALETHTVYLTFALESFVCRFTVFVNPRAWLWLCNSWEQPTFPGKGMKWHDVEPLVISHLLWWLRMKPSLSDRKSILSVGKRSC